MSGARAARRRGAHAARLLAACIALGCSETPRTHAPDTAESRDVAGAQAGALTATEPAVVRDAAAERSERAAALIERHECSRCHDGTASAPPSRERDCVGCHRAIRAGTFRAPAAALARWQGRIHSLLVAPDLRHAGARLRRDWVATFLQHPHDLRPGLAASMPRLALDARDAELLAEQLVPEESEAASDVLEGDAETGRQLYIELRCARCHRFTGAPLPKTHAGPAELGLDARARRDDAVVLAPDLVHARARVQRGKLAPWLQNPQALAPGSLMPPHGLDARGASDLAAFLVRAPLVAPPEPRARVPLPLLSRPVRWDEVSRRLLRKVCWHCHATPDYALGDGGPGYSGGFGFAARGLDLSSYEGISSGSVDDDGRRRSVFAPLRDGTPRLLAHLLARAEEEAGHESALRGMPLGFPALTPEEIQLVASWIAQGRPR